MFALKENIARHAASCAVDLCWRQWRSLTAAGIPIGARPVTSILDPEALVLLSLTVRQHERRLDDQLLWWAAAGSSLLGVQRTRTMLADFPERTGKELARFAAMAVEAGDHRWKVLVDGAKHTPSGREGKGPRELQLLEPSTLMLRLRAGFGVGAKADLLAFLIGIASSESERTAWATAEVIAKAISYSVASTRRAATEMALARLVESSADRPAQYSVDAPAWAHVLQLRDPFQPPTGADNRTTPAFDIPPWRFWTQMSAFLAACVELGEDAHMARAAPVVQSSHLRDLAERFRRPLAWNGIEWLDPKLYPGERYLEAFASTLDRVVAWVVERA